ncbi:MAG: prephenate dehydratase [Deltaproteobacteria bacterium]|nr:prephenate dehydratase [Deltaproteobacteria bacterium]
MADALTTDELTKLRAEIDRIDEAIVRLLNERADVVMRVGEFKQQNRIAFYAPQREREVFDRISEANAGPFPSDALRAVYREIVSACLALEKPLRVAYLGPEATFTHLACKEHFGLSAVFAAQKGIPDVFEEVARERADFGVVPIENSTEGVVSHTLDTFVDSDLVITAEVLLAVSHHLLTKTGTLSSVRKVFSHPQALAQCRRWLDRNLPGVPLIDVASTALAAELASRDLDSGAVAGELAAQLYDLRIVENRIEDSPQNFTRFLVVGREATPRTGSDKTSLMFSVKDSPGILYRALKPFHDNAVNLTKIESRPSKKRAWEYIFFIDLDGHGDDAAVADAISTLRASCQMLRVLGSYPKAAP